MRHKNQITCKHCKSFSVRNGKQKNGKQRYYCKGCKISFQNDYTYNAYSVEINKSIYNLLKESVGISSISRLLHISKTTVIKHIKAMSKRIVKPINNETHQYYELDEMRVLVGCKENQAWIIYAINRNTKDVANFVIGRRTKHNISLVTKCILQLNPKMIYTDKLPTYKKLIPKRLHNTTKKNTMIIERHNLTLRTHLKRLTRKTICFSKTFEMLEATLKLYLWGNQLQF